MGTHSHVEIGIRDLRACSIRCNK